MLLLLAAAVIASGLTIGMRSIGHGIAARNTDGITVTGSAQIDVSADRAEWTMSVEETGPSFADAIAKVDAGIDAVTSFVTRGGIAPSAQALGAVSASLDEETVNGTRTGKILGYRAHRALSVSTTNLALVTSLSQGLGAVLRSGVNVSSSGPSFYVSNLAELRPRLLEEAMTDAKARAIALTQAVGGGIGSLRSARSGPVQVNARGSVQVADGGIYDTSTINKTVSTTVTVVFASD